MTFTDFIKIRLNNGKITAGYQLESGKVVRSDKYSKCIPEDMMFLERYGNNMSEFWEHADTQMALLWAIRGLGHDSVADTLWNDLGKEFNIVLHKKAISDEERKLYADIIRSKCPMPDEFKEG
jgi:hypothetical protein